VVSAARGVQIRSVQSPYTTPFPHSRNTASLTPSSAACSTSLISLARTSPLGVVRWTAPTCAAATLILRGIVGVGDKDGVSVGVGRRVGHSFRVRRALERWGRDVHDCLGSRMTCVDLPMHACIVYTM
jgi:hypothetical protein